MTALSKYKSYPEYKDSGIAWLGKIPKDWDLERGKILFSTVRISAFPDDEQLAASQKFGVIPQRIMMELNDAKVMLALKGTDSFRHVESDNFVISLRSFEGGIEHSEYIGCVSPAYTVLAAKQKMYPYFFKYLFKSKPFICVLQATTDSLRDGKSISYEQFGAIQVPNITLKEQTKIAQFLDHETAKIDLLIEKQQKLIELLKEKHQTVISHAVTKGLDPNVKMKDSGVEWLGEVPEHWEMTKLGFLTLKIGSGKTPKGGAEIYDSKGILFLRSQNIYNDGLHINENESVYISQAIHEDMKNSQVIGGDILLNITGGSIGRTCLTPMDFQEANVNQHVCIVRVSPKINKFISHILKSQIIQNQINLSQTGGNREGLNFEQISKLFFVLPPLSEQIEIVEYIDIQTSKIDLLIQKAKQQIELIKERRSALISAAVTGKIDVRDWQTPN